MLALNPPIRAFSPRFGAWWRLPWRAPLAHFVDHLKRATSGHLMFGPNGHLVSNCLCCNNSAPAAYDVVISGATMGLCKDDCVVLPHGAIKWVSGTINGSYHLTKVQPGIYEYTETPNPIVHQLIQGTGCVGSLVADTASSTFRMQLNLSEAPTAIGGGFYRFIAWSTHWSGFAFNADISIRNIQDLALFYYYAPTCPTNCDTGFTMTQTFDTFSCSKPLTGATATFTPA